MTYTSTPETPEFVQSLIALSHRRKEMLAAALDNARKSLESTPHTAQWQPYAPTPAEQRVNARAERLAWLVDSI